MKFVPEEFLREEENLGYQGGS